jgi:hypothetical protein
MGRRNQAAIRATKPSTDAAASQMNFRFWEAGGKGETSLLAEAKRSTFLAVPEL